MRCLAVILTTSSLICNSVVVFHTAPTAHPALLTQMAVKQWNYYGKWDTIYGCNSKDQYICSVSFVAIDMTRDSNEWDAKESNFSLWFANTSHTS